MTLELNDTALAVLDKVRKLLAMANSATANENEAAIATAKAMELLAQHNLDMATVGESRTSSNRQDTKRAGGLYSWQRQLWNAVAELNFCKYWYIPGTGRGQQYQHRVLGRRENVVATEVLADYLQKTVDRLAQEWAKAQGMNVFKREAIIYREGMAERLVGRLNDLRRKKLAEERAKAEQAQTSSSPSGGTALVLASVIASEEDLNNDYLQGWEPGTTSRRRAEDKAAQAANLARWKQQREEAEARRDAEEAANPALKEARLAREEAAKQEEAERQAKWDAEYQKKQAAKRKRDEAYFEQHGHYPQQRQTAADRRRNSDEFWEGYDRGGGIGLDQQLTEEERRALS